MAKALLIVSRGPSRPDALAATVEGLNRSLTPDNESPRTPQSVFANQVTAVVFNPNSATSIRGASIRIGMTTGDAASQWDRPGAKAPDGSYALFRCDERQVELVADAAASRTMWYVQLEDRFIASTSQRAIVSVLGDFQANPNVIPWMLSTGTLGPSGGWDSRLAPLRPGERLMLDRKSWQLKQDIPPRQFFPARHLSKAQHAQNLADILDDVSEDFRFDTAKWVLPLSGGVDSRGLLAMLRSEHADLRTITWGLSSATSDPRNDARIAHQVARQFGVENRFFSTNLSTEPRSRLINRFLLAGEGRIANIPPFLDGFSVWSTLYNEGLDGIVRGDEAFGSSFVCDEKQVRENSKLALMSDHFDAATLESFELAPQPMPDHLARLEGESLSTWRDRLYQEHRLPKLLAGLTDLQANYVEVVNPLLSRRLLEFTRTLPDELRTGKVLWREYVQIKSGNLPFARSPAVLQLLDFLEDKLMLEMMSAELADDAIFSPALRAKICTGLRSRLLAGTSQRRRVSVRSRLGLIAPIGIRNAVRRWLPAKNVLEPTLLAFRALIVVRMNRLLAADAATLNTDVRDSASLRL